MPPPAQPPPSHGNWTRIRGELSFGIAPNRKRAIKAPIIWDLYKRIQNPTVHGLGDDFFTEQRIIAAIAVMSPVFIPFGACLVVIVLWYNCVARRIQRQIEKADKQRQPSSLQLTASQDTLQDPPPTIRIDQ
ncbi:unnamed protein product, partial [Mesorhabditis spiculigera]